MSRSLVVLWLSETYHNLQGVESPFPDHIIRERVSTNGVLRPLEPEESLPGCTLPTSKLGVISETGARRYLEGQALWDKKFKDVSKKVARDRERHMKQTMKHVGNVLDRIQAKLDNVRRKDEIVSEDKSSGPRGALNAEPDDSQIRLILNSPLWTWNWALEGEDPPPSSIAARGDTVGSHACSRRATIPSHLHLSI